MTGPAIYPSIAGNAQGRGNADGDQLMKKDHSWSAGRGAGVGGALTDEQADMDGAGPRHTLFFLNPKGCSASASFRKMEKHSFRPASSTGHLEGKTQNIIGPSSE